jgi:two-component system chemotaxis sensor kinase CheA
MRKNIDKHSVETSVNQIANTLSQQLLDWEMDITNPTRMDNVYRSLRVLLGWFRFAEMQNQAKVIEQLTFFMLQANESHVESEIIDLLLDILDTLHSDQLFCTTEIQNPWINYTQILESKLTRKEIPTVIAPIDISDTDELLAGKELEEFTLSLSDTIDKLESNIVAFEKENKSEFLQEIFRLFHNCKGESNYIGFTKLADLSHITENLLDALRQEKVVINEQAMEALYDSLDILKMVYVKLLNGETRVLSNTDILNLKTKVEFLLGDEIQQVKKQDKENAVANSPYVNLLLQHKLILSQVTENWNGDKTDLYIRILRDLFNISKKHNDIDLVASSKEGIDALAEQNAIRLYACIQQIIVNIETIITHHQPINPSPVKEVEHVEISNIGSAQQTTEEVKTMRVDERKINEFANIVGELFVAKNAYEYLLSEAIKNNNLQASKQFKDNLYLFNKLTNGLQDAVMSLRMIPIKGVFDKFHRVVRDISKKQAKEIELVTFGSTTEVDKKIADALSEPLIHLVRNSCDHGIETPQERQKAGKTDKGTIVLNASQEGNNLVIKIMDDGKGIDKAKIWEKAKKNNINTTNYSEDNILDLIFEPGFSTADTISDVSGRGVGMDVVKTTIQKLKGSIRINTELQKGTEIVIIIPMSIGVSTSLLIKQQQNTYAIPFESIVETLKIEESKLVSLHNSLGYYYRNKMIPVIELGTLFSKNKQVVQRKNKLFVQDILNLVVVKTPYGEFGLLVDQLLQYLELSIKQLPDEIAHIHYFTGVSILGDGNLVLILNPEGLATTAIA